MQKRKKTRRTITVSLDEKVIVQIEELAQQKLVTRSKMIEIAIVQLLKSAHSQTVVQL